MFLQRITHTWLRETYEDDGGVDAVDVGDGGSPDGVSAPLKDRVEGTPLSSTLSSPPP